MDCTRGKNSIIYFTISSKQCLLPFGLVVSRLTQTWCWDYTSKPKCKKKKNMAAHVVPPSNMAEHERGQKKTKPGSVTPLRSGILQPLICPGGKKREMMAGKPATETHTTRKVGLVCVSSAKIGENATSEVCFTSAFTSFLLFPP